MGDEHRRIVRDGYDRCADSYLADRPDDGEDVALLAELVSRLRVGDRLLDAGCGAGVPVAACLVDAGFEVIGLDFSRGQLDLARSSVPAASVTQADLGALPFADASFRGVVSYYAIIHVPRGDHARTYAEFRRVLQSGGYALLCLGAQDIPEDRDDESWLGVQMVWSHFDAETNLAMLTDAGFDVCWHRLVADPMEHGQHLFVLARS